MEYRKEGNTIFVRLHEKDEIMKSLEEVAQKENITTCTVQGIGAITNIEIGINKYKLKKYETCLFTNDYELTSLSGNIKMIEGKAKAHLHATMNDDDFKTIGGHLFKAEVTATAEIILTAFKADLSSIFKL